MLDPSAVVIKQKRQKLQHHHDMDCDNELHLLEPQRIIISESILSLFPKLSLERYEKLYPRNIIAKISE